MTLGESVTLREILGRQGVPTYLGPNEWQGRASCNRMGVFGHAPCTLPLPSTHRRPRREHAIGLRVL